MWPPETCFHQAGTSADLPCEPQKSCTDCFQLKPRIQPFPMRLDRQHPLDRTPSIDMSTWSNRLQRYKPVLASNRVLQRTSSQCYSTLSAHGLWKGHADGRQGRSIGRGHLEHMAPSKPPPLNSTLLPESEDFYKPQTLQLFQKVLW